jgi:hypothetical protein
MIDPERRRAAFYRRSRDQEFSAIDVGTDAIFRSGVVKGLWLRVHWLRERPPLITILREWKLI